MIIGKEMEGSSCGLNLRYYPGICAEGLRITTKNLNQKAGLRAEN
jgi:hypothetical protein